MKLNEITGSDVWLVIHQREGAPDLMVLGIFSTEKTAIKCFEDFCKENDMDQDDNEGPPNTYVQKVKMNKRVDIDIQ